jgi:hypothetical protein
LCPKLNFAFPLGIAGNKQDTCTTRLISATPALRSRLHDSARPSRSLAGRSPISQGRLPFPPDRRPRPPSRLLRPSPPHGRGSTTVPQGKSLRTLREIGPYLKGRTVLRGKDFRTSREEIPYLKGRIPVPQGKRIARKPALPLPLRNTGLFQNNLKTFPTTNSCCCRPPRDGGTSRENRRPGPSRIRIRCRAGTA